MKRLGFVGAGRMGLPMVRRLVAGGHEVRVLGRSPERRRALAAEGALVGGCVEDVADGADAVLVCVYTDEQVREVCLGSALLDVLPEGAAIVVHTTGSPRTVEAVAARAAARRIQVVDAPVSGGPHDIAAGRVTVFAGGDEDAVARLRPVLGRYADPVLHVGPLGAGQRVKLVNNALFAAHIVLLSDAIRLGRRLGVDEAVLLHALPHGSATSRALTGVAARGSVARFAEAVREFVDKDVEVVRQVAAELGTDLGALAPVIGPHSGGGSGPSGAG
ncbi:NAD(P)-dependent oxidoreductase [Streptomyces himalayensis]|uniref:NAD(P)-dependent oxidoreductase n=1 Tax=Streptomyces himalayensis subsp. himalayensis TaxID=2756131 RepID=A0A7W0DMJ1_9ACTN|nr:NAD(P)-dependent oxidoreductase [Streptomyces himalayensis]MBA2947827.1 NAD(P)-dependent oxidoreductase [Streptomyces himalayensis subsp. himalayensis]